MTERWGTIFEYDGKKAIRHRVREQDSQTICKIVFKILRNERYQKGVIWAWYQKFHMASEASMKEIRCKKCYPKPKRRKTWPTSSKKK